MAKMAIYIYSCIVAGIVLGLCISYAYVNISFNSQTGTAPNYENVSDLSKQLSSSANELSDRWADRTPYGQVPPYAQGGVWRHYHSSPSKRLIGRKKGIENYYGSKACLPGMLLLLACTLTSL